MKFIYVSIKGEDRKIILEENNNFSFYSEIVIEGPSKIVTSYRNGFENRAIHVWIETESSIKGTKIDAKN